MRRRELLRGPDVRRVDAVKADGQSLREIADTGAEGRDEHSLSSSVERQGDRFGRLGPQEVEADAGRTSLTHPAHEIRTPAVLEPLGHQQDVGLPIAAGFERLILGRGGTVQSLANDRQKPDRSQRELVLKRQDNPLALEQLRHPLAQGNHRRAVRIDPHDRSVPTTLN